jgi:O-succinylhomoserine sulfhydrylase
VSQTDVQQWRDAMQPNTKLLFAETPSNPLTEVCDIRALADIAHEAGALLAVDNCFCTPALQQPIKLGADLIMHSGTKYLDGQGRVLAGAVCGTDAIVNGKLMAALRGGGMSLSPFNAWVVLKGLETLSIRMAAQSANALNWPSGWSSNRVSTPCTTQVCPAIRSTRWPWRSKTAAVAPWCPSPPSPRPVLSPHRPSGGRSLARLRQAAFHAIDQTRLCSITSNLGDTKTLITHPASTSHGRLSEAQRLAAGITQGMIRVAVGLEHIDDLKADLARGLDTLNV